MRDIKPCAINGLKLTCLLFLSLFLSACGGDKGQPKRPPPLVSTVTIGEHDIPVYKDYIGITKSVASVDIKARVKGFLIKKNFTEGKAVKKGQLIYVIDPKPFEAKLDLSEGKLEKDQAEEKFEHVEYLRMKTLVKQGAVSKNRFDKVSAQYREAIADVKIAAADVEQAKINLGYCYMYAPFDGIIGRKYVDVGNLVGGTDQTTLANIVVLDPIYIEFSPSVSDYADFLNYQQDMPFSVKVVMPHNEKQVFHGKMDLINNQANVKTSTILMRASIDNPKNLLLPGIYANVRVIMKPHSKALLVPTVAVQENQGQRFVYLLGEGNKVVSQNIKVANEYQHQYVVTSGLKAGDVVITDGLQKIRPGEVVHPTNNGKTAHKGQTATSTSSASDSGTKNAEDKNQVSDKKTQAEKSKPQSR